jgi:hypothetical protein
MKFFHSAFAKISDPSARVIVYGAGMEHTCEGENALCKIVFG